jgi:hypothetical protein
VVRHQEVGMPVKCFFDHDRDGVHGEQHPAYFITGVATDEPDGVPWLGQPRIVQRIKCGDHVGERRHAWQLIERLARAGEPTPS